MIYITFTYRHRKEILLGLILFVIVGVGITIIIFNYSKPKEKPKINTIVTKKQKKEETTEEEEYKVDIKGEVINPGIYTLKKDSRVIDVIEQAGGLTENANTSVINLSKKINDEMVIIIYSNNEIRNFEKTKEQEEYLQKKCLQSSENSLQNNACISSNQASTSTQSTEKISLNNATQEQLMTLPGIGEAKAKEIIKYREKTPFTKIEDLKEISGIGDSIFAKIKDLITL